MIINDLWSILRCTHHVSARLRIRKQVAPNHDLKPVKFTSDSQIEIECMPVSLSVRTLLADACTDRSRFRSEKWWMKHTFQIPSNRLPLILAANVKSNFFWNWRAVTNLCFFSRLKSQEVTRGPSKRNLVQERFELSSPGGSPFSVSGSSRSAWRNESHER